jgi:hypothetical protein
MLVPFTNVATPSTEGGAGTIPHTEISCNSMHLYENVRSKVLLEDSVSRDMLVEGPIHNGMALHNIVSSVMTILQRV